MHLLLLLYQPDDRTTQGDCVEVLDLQNGSYVDSWPWDSIVDISAPKDAVAGTEVIMITRLGMPHYVFSCDRARDVYDALER
jgi:hypothetical protein